MTHSDESRIATALREASLHDEGARIGLTEILEGHVQGILFQARALAPVPGLVWRSAEHGKAEFKDLSRSDAAVVALFDEHVRRMIDDFIQAPESWEDDASRSFIDQLGLVLGIERDLVPRAIRLFHGCPEGQRIGIFMMMENSSPFQYLSHEIDSCEDEVAVQHPSNSLRDLVKAVWAE